MSLPQLVVLQLLGIIIIIDYITFITTQIIGVFWVFIQFYAFKSVINCSPRTRYKWCNNYESIENIIQ